MPDPADGAAYSAIVLITILNIEKYKTRASQADNRAKKRKLVAVPAGHNAVRAG